VEGKLVPIQASEDIRQQRDVFLQTNLLPYGCEVLFADTAKFRVVQEQIGKFTALLDKMDFRKAGHPLLEFVNSKQFAEY
jgi:hypothetical protein